MCHLTRCQVCCSPYVWFAFCILLHCDVPGVECSCTTRYYGFGSSRIHVMFRNDNFQATLTASWSENHLPIVSTIKKFIRTNNIWMDEISKTWRFAVYFLRNQLLRK